MNAQPQEPVSEDEFWDLEKNSEQKLEHIGGRVHAMASGGYTHARLIVRLNALLENGLRGKQCTPLGSEFYVQVESTGDKFLPDNVVHCDQPKFGSNKLTLLNPIVVFEILSPGTASFDQGDKFDLYARIATLSDYVLISQNFVKITHFSRQEDAWLRRTWTQLEDVLRLPSIKVELSLRELYDGLDVPLQFILFPAPESESSND